MRTYGLSGSGMDVDQMVKDLMKARKVSYDRLHQKKTQTEWKKADYNKIFKSVSDFRSALVDYKLESTLVPKKVTSSDDKYVTAAANAEAINVGHSIHVTQLASEASAVSSGKLGSIAGAPTLKNQFGGAFSGVKEFTITNNGKTGTVKIDTDNESVYDLVSKIKQMGIDVSAAYDPTVDRFFLSTTNTGKTATLDIDGPDAGWFKGAFKLDTVNPGKNANFTLDNVVYDDSNSNFTKNTFTLAGVTYTLKNTMPDGYNTSLRVDNDVDKAVATVKGLIEAYNKVITEINAKTGEKYYKDFLPLTDEQKKDMKEGDIKLWEEKARSGLLRRNTLLTSLNDRMRMDFSGVIAGVNSEYKSAAAVGITTGSYIDEDGKINNESQRGGILYLTEKGERKLREAIQADPAILQKLFAADGEDHSHDGIAVRLSNTLDQYLKDMKKEAGISAAAEDQSALGKAIADYKGKLTDMAKRMKIMETRYYRQFDAMERAIQRMNQQSSWLAQQFSGASK